MAFVEIGTVAAVRNVTSYISNMNRVGAATATATARISASIRAVNRNTFSGLGRSVDLVGVSLQRLGGQLSSVGSTMSALISFPVIGAFASAARAGAQYESILKRIRNLSHVTNEQVAFFAREMLRLGPILGQLPTELAEGLFLITSAGISNTAEAMEILEASAKGSAIGLGTTAQVVDSVTSLMIAYGSANLTAGQSVEFLTQASKTAKGEVKALAPAIGRALGFATSLNVAPEEVLGFIAAYTRLGQTPSQAVTALINSLNLFARPSERAKATLERFRLEGDKTNLTVERLREVLGEQGLARTLIALRQAMGDEFFELFPQRGLFGALAVTSESQAATYLAIVDEIKNGSGALEEAFLNSAEGIEFRWKGAMSALQGAGIEFFQTMRPILTDVLDSVTRFLVQLREVIANNPQLAQLAFRFGLIAAAAGPLLIILGQIVRAFGSLVSIAALPLRAIGAVVALLGRGFISLIAPIATVTRLLFTGMVGGFGLITRLGGMFLFVIGSIGVRINVLGKFIANFGLHVLHARNYILGLIASLRSFGATAAGTARILGGTLANSLRFAARAAGFFALEMAGAIGRIALLPGTLAQLGANLATSISGGLVRVSLLFATLGTRIRASLFAAIASASAVGGAFSLFFRFAGQSIRAGLVGIVHVLTSGFPLIARAAGVMGRTFATGFIGTAASTIGRTFRAITVPILAIVTRLGSSIITRFAFVSRGLSAVFRTVVLVAGRSALLLSGIFLNLSRVLGAIAAPFLRLGVIISVLFRNLQVIVLNVFRGIGVAFGATLLPILRSVAANIAAVVTGIMGRVTALASGVLATIGSTITTVVGQLVTAVTGTVFTTLTSVIGSLVAVVGGAIASVATFGVSLIGLLAPIIAISLAITGLIVLIGKIGPQIAAFFTNVGTKVREFATNTGTQMRKFGDGAAKSYGQGLIDGLIYIVQALRAWVRTITFWLAPGSPPRLLPDLTNWGSGAMAAYFEGWSNFDFSAFSDISGKIRSFLESILPPDAGTDLRLALIEQIDAVRFAVAEAINEINQTGSLSTSAWDAVNAAIGSSVPEVQRYVQAMLSATQASERLREAQERIQEIQENFRAPLQRIDDQLKKITDRRQEISDEMRQEELEEILRDPRLRRVGGRDRERVIELAELELREINLRAQRGAIETEQQRQLRLAEAQLAAAELDNEIAQEELATAQSILDILIENNRLLQEALELEQQKEDEEKAAKEEAAGAGDAGGVPGVVDFGDLPEPAGLDPGDLEFPKFEDPTGELDAALEALREELGGLGNESLILWYLVQIKLGEAFDSLKTRLTEISEHPLVAYIMDNFRQTVEDTMEAFASTSGMNIFSDSATGLQTVLGILLALLGGLSAGFRAFFTPMGAVLGQLLTDLGELATLFELLFLAFETLGSSPLRAMQAIPVLLGAISRQILATIGRLILGFLHATIQGILGFIEGIVTSFQLLGTQSGAVILRFIGRLRSWFQRFYNWLIGNSLIPDLVNGIIDWFKKLPGSVLGIISGWIWRVIGYFTTLKDNAIAKFLELRDQAVQYTEDLRAQAIAKYEELRQKVTDAVEAIRAWVDEKLGIIKGYYDTYVQPFIDDSKKKYDEFQKKVEETIEAARKWVDEKFNAIKGYYDTYVKPFVDDSKKKFDELLAKVQETIEAARKFISEKLAAVHGYYTTYIKPFVDDAVEKFNAFQSGVEAAFGLAGQAISAFISLLETLLSLITGNDFTVNVGVNDNGKEEEEEEDPNEPKGSLGKTLASLREIEDKMHAIDQIHARVNLTAAYATIPNTGVRNNNLNMQTTINGGMDAVAFEALLRRLLTEMIS